MKDELRALFDEVIADLDIHRVLQQPETLARLRAPASLLVIAFGKAARPMAQAVVDLRDGGELRGLVVPPEPDAAPLAPFEVVPGGHPLPSDGSLRAARRALELAAGVQSHEEILFLISGGGSAMLELAADERVSLKELRALHQALVGSGADIDEINTVRMQVSAIKGGRLALAGAAAARQLTFAISDVPAGSHALASAPTTPCHTSSDDCRSVLDRFELWPKVPTALRARMDRNHLPPTMPPSHELTKRIAFWPLLDESTAAATATRALMRMGCVVAADANVDNWPYQRAAAHLLESLEQVSAAHSGKRVAIVTTGELSVPLPDQPGTGGRNQQFALQCAALIADKPITIMSCGTDGIDGNSHAAGAIVDGTTVARATAAGLDTHTQLERCDAFPLLEALGDAVVTGPTGSNVRDLRVLIHEPQ